MSIISARQTLVSEVLHLVEDWTWETTKLLGPSPGVTIKELVAQTEKSETTIRKAVNELEAGGFIRKNDADGRSWRYVAVRKQDAEEVKNMADDTTTATRGRPRDPQVQARDEQVVAAVKKAADGATVEEVAQALGIERNAAYLSIWRLRKDGRVEKVKTGTRTPRWVLKG